MQTVLFLLFSFLPLCVWPQKQIKQTGAQTTSYRDDSILPIERLSDGVVFPFAPPQFRGEQSDSVEGFFLFIVATPKEAGSSSESSVFFVSDFIPSRPWGPSEHWQNSKYLDFFLPDEAWAETFKEKTFEFFPMLYFWTGLKAEKKHKRLRRRANKIFARKMKRKHQGELSFEHRLSNSKIPQTASLLGFSYYRAISLESFLLAGPSEELLDNLEKKKEEFDRFGPDLLYPVLSPIESLRTFKWEALEQQSPAYLDFNLTIE